MPFLSTLSCGLMSLMTFYTVMITQGPIDIVILRSPVHLDLVDTGNTNRIDALNKIDARFGNMIYPVPCYSPLSMRVSDVIFAALGNAVVSVSPQAAASPDDDGGQPFHFVATYRQVEVQDAVMTSVT